MKRITLMMVSAFALAGCYDKTPNESESVEIAKQEVSMALCGDRMAACITEDAGQAHIGERLDDHTNKITVTFTNIRAKYESDGAKVPTDFSGGGLVVFEFDAKNGKTYVKEISVWSDDGSQSISLCGHDYTFCRK